MGKGQKTRNSKMAANGNKCHSAANKTMAKPRPRMRPVGNNCYSSVLSTRAPLGGGKGLCVCVFFLLTLLFMSAKRSVLAIGKNRFHTVMEASGRNPCYLHFSICAGHRWRKSEKVCMEKSNITGLGRMVQWILFAQYLQSCAAVPKWQSHHGSQPEKMLSAGW